MHRDNSEMNNSYECKVTREQRLWCVQNSQAREKDRKINEGLGFGNLNEKESCNLIMGGLYAVKLFRAAPCQVQISQPLLKTSC